ncbi:DUF2612 domain-containing protein [Actinobacillus pleuropneumoniae]|uniref:DUF2612 domain-containing protein n=1 Tax=Actinobacillus pleuropneumoniae TaxID=715 RepID=UPI0022786F49|nr:DUF2612 domain-containing protein [Actinobacillus pleuropneumoniae]MCY6395079.1 DUF2612 domain-containing protein [Actinobacillus pleuropneumoniae]MCY6408879.1 DUF2612 domain-containing protein [Actinobacillus pleuropneumoniae]
MNALNENFAEIGWQHTLLQFSCSPNLKALYYTLLSPYSGIQQSLEQLLLERHFDAAIGKQLDGIGDIVGLSRPYVTIVTNQWWFGFQGQSMAKTFKQAPIRDENYYKTSSNTQFMSDDNYLRLLKWKVIANNSHGTVEDIIRAYQAIFNASKIQIEEHGNGSISIKITRKPIKELQGVEKSAVDWCPVSAGINATVFFIDED